MKFGLMVDLGRVDPDTSMQQVIRNTTEIVKAADAVGFDMVFCGEHHGHERTIAPAPFTLLTHWAAQTTNVRLGTAVLCAPYWHPIRLAGEASLFDHLSGGRLELGIGRGAYPYEFARMAAGIPPEVARQQLDELLPALRGLWEGNYAHDGTMWKFPSTTATPRPLSPEGPPIWVSARHPDVFKTAVQNRCDVMVAPLAMGFEEVESLRERLDTAVSVVGNGHIPRMMVLRNTYVASEGEDPMLPVHTYRRDQGTFQNLYSTDGKVDNGWVEYIDPATSTSPSQYDNEDIARNMMFGTVDVVLEKMSAYEKAGTDVYLYDAGWGLDLDTELASIERFGSEVIPKFRGNA
ncbi:LLM class flavin-dependent oxidoreductase [Mycobacterium sp. NPDC006124]|uniref:LLM class flavin-dependent oxidoreductase n=1 Tax=Mycobacterium sp. NPDC006124 TaxID=3156729 RepID=UPI0033A3856D